MELAGKIYTPQINICAKLNQNRIYWNIPNQLRSCFEYRKIQIQISTNKLKKKIKKKKVKDEIKLYQIGNGLLTRFGECQQDTTFLKAMVTVPMATP